MVRLACHEASLSPPVKYSMTVPRRYFFRGSFVLFMTCGCRAFASVHCCLVVTCWERANLLALGLVSNCEVVTFLLVSWVRCGGLLDRFLIFVLFLTLFKLCHRGHITTTCRQMFAFTHTIDPSDRVNVSESIVFSHDQSYTKC